MTRITVKERLLQVFHENPGVYFSGEQLAGKLSCTRAAVWKVVEALRKEGYLIDGTTNCGYTVRGEGDALSAQLIMSHLTEADSEVFRAETRKTTDSTNNDVRARGISGEPEGLVIAAEEQTNGRGRQGRSFFSPEKQAGHPDSTAIIVTNTDDYKDIKVCALGTIDSLVKLGTVE